jgi:hypothetical protein
MTAFGVLLAGVIVGLALLVAGESIAQAIREFTDYYRSKR